MKQKYFCSIIIAISIFNWLSAQEYEKVRKRAEDILREAEAEYGLKKNDLGFHYSLKGASEINGLFPPYLIVLNSKIINDEDEVTNSLYHELGHAEDRSALKQKLVMGTYYPLSIAVPNFIFHWISKYTPMSIPKTVSHIALTASGIAGAWYFYEKAQTKVTRHFEKRTDLIALKHLLAQNKFPAICNRLAYLEQAKLLDYVHDSDHPSIDEEYEYTKKFLEQNGIKMKSKAKKNQDQTADGSISLIKDSKTFLGYTWQWKPKC